MRKLTTLLAIVMVAGLATAAVAQNPWWQDSIGIYTAEGLNCVAVSSYDPLENPVHVFLVLKQCSSPDGILGWECKLPVSGPIVMTSANPVGLHIDGDTAPDGFAIGLAVPMPWEAELVLMEMTYFVQAFSTQGSVFIQANRYPSLPGGLPVYIDGGDVNFLKHMWPATEDVSVPVFVINGDCPVGTVESSWGQVKNLYR